MTSGQKVSHIKLQQLQKTQCKGKGKVVPAHAIKAYGGLEVNTLVTLPIRYEFQIPIEQEARWVPEPVWMLSEEEINCLTLFAVKQQFLRHQPIT